MLQKNFSAAHVGASDPEVEMEVREISLESLMRRPGDGPVPKNGDPDRVERKNILDFFMYFRDRRRCKGIKPLTNHQLVRAMSFLFFFHSISFEVVPWLFFPPA